MQAARKLVRQGADTPKGPLHNWPPGFSPRLPANVPEIYCDRARPEPCRNPHDDLGDSACHRGQRVSPGSTFLLTAKVPAAVSSEVIFGVWVEVWPVKVPAVAIPTRAPGWRRISCRLSRGRSMGGCTNCYMRLAYVGFAVGIFGSPKMAETTLLLLS